MILHVYGDRMGALLSKRKRDKHKESGSGSEGWCWSGPPGRHSSYPIDYVAYPGEELLYCFVDMMVSYKILQNEINLGHQVVTTDVEEFHYEFDECYNNDFVLHQFAKVPCIHSTIAIQKWGDTQAFQAIFTKPVKCHEKTEHWEMKIEKRILSTRTLATDEWEMDNDLINTIKEYALTGAQLLCATPVGYVRSTSPNEQYAVMGVDLFFNIPKHKMPNIYRYHIIKLTTRYFVTSDATQSIQRIECDADWMGQLKLFLSEGWKLVDIVLDNTALADAFGMKKGRKRIDTIWIFEKEESQLSDPTPRYEGCILEYLHKVKKSSSGPEMPCRDWRPVLAGMGVTGWELACIIQTPILVQTSFSVYAIKLLMFFQRRIYPEHQTATADYIALYKKRGYTVHRYGLGYTRSLPAHYNQPHQKVEPKGYYNKFLKRYVVEEEEEKDDSSNLVANGTVTTGMAMTPSTSHRRLNNMASPPTYDEVTGATIRRPRKFPT